MITITTVGKITIDAIKAGYKTNNEIAEYLSTPEAPITGANIGSRVTRLRKQGIVRAFRDTSIRGNSMPLIYTITDATFEILDGPKQNRFPKEKRIKYYRDAGEPTFDNLNNFIYPKKLAGKLNTI